MKKEPLIILTGPTAVGKTALSIKLAQTLNASIISADSMQVYRHMDIGSAKIRKEEMDGVQHYLIDILEPMEAFNVFLFQKLAKEAITEIRSQGKIPMIVGGTGFYIQSVLYDIDFTEAEEISDFRKTCEKQAETAEGRLALYERLKKVDPKAAEEIHPHNVKRVIRALEFFEQNQSPISQHNEEQRAKESPYDFRYFVLTRERSELYANIELRVDQMMQEGLLDEVKRLREMGCKADMTSMQGLGYKEIMAHLDGRCTLDEAVNDIKKNTRHFAKRQLTWFRREADVIWIDKGKEDGYERILQTVSDL